MGRRGERLFARRMVASGILATDLFVALYVSFVIALNPDRAFYNNISSNPGGMLFSTTMFFVFYGVPIWGVCFLILSLVGPYRRSLEKAAPASDEELS